MSARLQGPGPRTRRERKRKPRAVTGHLPRALTPAPPPLGKIEWATPDPVLAAAICRIWLPATMPATPWAPHPPLKFSDRTRAACGWCVVAALCLLALAGLAGHHA